MRQSFVNLGVEGVRIHLAHRGVFNRTIARLGLTAQAVEILRTVDKIKKIGEEEVLKSLTGLAGEAAAREILDYIKPEESFEKTLDKITRLAGGEAEDTARLRSILSWMTALKIGDFFVLDPSITRGLDYYTGIVFETFLTELPAIGSVCSGGRYNDLASLYTKEKLPGVGASVGLDRLLAALEELGKKPNRKSATDLLVFCVQPSLYAEYHRIAQAFRAAGIPAEVYPEAKKLAAQFTFAEKKGIPLGIILGEEELAKGVMSLRDLVNREATDGLGLDGALAEAKKLLGKA